MAITLPRAVFPISNSAGLSFTIGALLGLIGATMGVGPIGILLISLIYFWKERNRARLIFSVPIFQYLIVQFGLTWWHSGDPFPIELQSYYALVFLAIPIIHFFITDFDYDEEFFVKGILTGLFLSTSLLALDYFTAWNDSRSCRAKAFQANALRSSIHIVPLAAFLGFYYLKQEKRLIYAMSMFILMIVVSWLLTASRTTSYAAISVLIFGAVYMFASRKFNNGLILFSSLLIGIVLTVSIDQLAGCNSTGRLMNQASKFIQFPLKATEAVKQDLKVKKTVQEEQGGNTPNPSVPNVIKKNDKRDAGKALGPRGDLWSRAVKEIRQHPFLGVGAHLERKIMNTNSHSGRVQPNAHNQFLSWAIYGGIVGAISGLILFLALPLTTSWSASVLSFSFIWIASSVSLSSVSLGGTMAEYLVTLVVLFRISGNAANKLTFVWKRMT